MIKSLTEVSSKMETYLEIIRKNERFAGIVPFLYTYYLVTKEVEKQKGSFEDFKNLERLDITFAKYFFTPLENVLNGKAPSKPWQTYFDYCLNNKGNYFLKMLLGINAHINGDLAISLFQNYKNNPAISHSELVSESDFKNSESIIYNDFLKINQILIKVTPKVMRFLTYEYKDIYGLGAWILKPLTIYEFNQTAVKWRNKAWGDYKKLTNQNIKNERDFIYERAEKMGNGLINIFTDKTPKGFLKLLPRLNSI